MLYMKIFLIYIWVISPDKDKIAMRNRGDSVSNLSWVGNNKTKYRSRHELLTQIITNN